MKHYISPFALNSDAMKLISKLGKNPSFEQERKVASILNFASCDPKMSSYQLSLSYKAMGDHYYDIGIYGGALSYYEAALELNPKLAVKRRVKELRAMPREELRVTVDINTADDIFTYPEYSRPQTPPTMSLRTESALDRLRRETFDELIEEAEEEDRIIDPSHEAEVERRLSALPPWCREAFYEERRQSEYRRQFEGSDVLTVKQQELLTLKSMEASVAWTAKHKKAALEGGQEV